MEKKKCHQSVNDIPNENINVSSNQIKKEDKKELPEEKISKINTMPENNTQNLNNYQIESFEFSMDNKISTATQTEKQYDQEYSQEEEEAIINILLTLRNNK